MIDEHTRLEACLRDLNARRPFEDYAPQPDSAERTRLAVQAIPFALPPVSRAAMEIGLGDHFEFMAECREKGVKRAIEDRIHG